ncbi:unnamed protein product [Cylicocyclus nassatus]|uniref:BPTI/Kunitz inhibitor domain-containing protein n=1 Tax=Cylicocyclus nassatus TaxID=53992 RepID=A0AA36DS99_CYLNA|nr:unnamed protein product [Cylicocyclus nassatus]
MRTVQDQKQMWLLLLLTFISPLYALPANCKLPVDLGKKCKGPPQTRYHFDPETRNCLPFGYTGCGGNGNNFQDAQKCYTTCMTADQLKISCAANAKPKGTCDKRGLCPSGTVCLFDGKSGICCDQQNEEKLQADLNPSCGNKKLLQQVINGQAFPVLGKKCSYNFCPKGSRELGSASWRLPRYSYRAFHNKARTQNLRKTKIMWHLLVLAMLFPLHVESENSMIDCIKSLRMGKQNCKTTPKIRYYFDANHYKCFPFKYTGCGGNDNNFIDWKECSDLCLPPAYFRCPGNGTKTGMCNEQYKWSKCPKGSTCVMANEYGFCCEDKDRKIAADENPDCGKKKVVKSNYRGYMGTLQGLSCSHNFCPKGSECRKGNYFSYCCQ